MLMRKLYDNFFDSEIINKGRQPEIDFVKFVLIFCLAIVHTFCEVSTDVQLDVFGVRYFWDSIVGGPFGAPAFIFCMGMGLAYSGKNTPQKLFFRGISLGIIAYILNLIIGVIPLLIDYAITGDKTYLADIPYMFFKNDILAFAALAMMLMALLFYLKLSSSQIVIVGLVLQIIATLVKDYHPKSAAVAV
ncbi:MAG: hypothetical protein K6G84_06870, partial [Lachnospiraceae bacterium]|nr:hypothetical protein [Lachnospiraceae bacterium]